MESCNLSNDTLLIDTGGKPHAVKGCRHVVKEKKKQKAACVFQIVIINLKLPAGLIALGSSVRCLIS